MSTTETIYEVWVVDPSSEYGTPETIAYFLTEPEATAFRDDYNALPVSDGIGMEGPPGRAYDSPAKVSTLRVGELIRDLQPCYTDNREPMPTLEWGPTRRIQDADHLRRIAAFLRGDVQLGAGVES